MSMDPWCNVGTHEREEVREGRSFNPDELAIGVEQVVVLTVKRSLQDAVL